MCQANADFLAPCWRHAVATDLFPHPAVLSGGDRRLRLAKPGGHHPSVSRPKRLMSAVAPDCHRLRAGHGKWLDGGRLDPALISASHGTFIPMRRRLLGFARNVLIKPLFRSQRLRML